MPESLKLKRRHDGVGAIHAQLLGEKIDVWSPEVGNEVALLDESGVRVVATITASDGAKLVARIDSFELDAGDDDKFAGLRIGDAIEFAEANIFSISRQ